MPGVRILDIGIETKNDTRPALNFTYMFSNVVGLDVMVSSSYKHDVRLNYDIESTADPDLKEAGHLNVMEFKQQPFALGAVFYPRGNRAARVHPYLGAGALYTRASLSIHGDAINFVRDVLEEEIKNNGWTGAVADARREDLESTLEEMQEDVSDSIRNDNWGAYAIAGADFKLTDRLLLNTQVRYQYSASDFKYWNYTLGLGYKF